MSARLTRLGVTTVILVFAASSLSAQNPRNRRDSANSRNASSGPNRTPTTPTAPTTPGDDVQPQPGIGPAPGVVTPPDQGYFPYPSAPPPGVPPTPPGLVGPFATPAPAGTVIPPVQGYYVNAPPASPGSPGIGPLPSDPLERAYWELFDHEKSVTLTGKVTRVDWGNPNSFIFLSAEGAVWAVESSYIQFRQSNATPPVHVGDNITVKAYLPKELRGDLPGRSIPWMAAFLKTEHFVRAGEITTGFGQKLLMGRPPTDEEMQERLKCSPFGC